MKERRSLIDGLKSTAEVQELEEEFVFGNKRTIEPVAPQPTHEPIAVPVGAIERQATVQQNAGMLPQITGRVPVTTRCRPEVATALKRASLQRQLAGAEPYYVQDIMEKALEEWLGAKGYL